MSVTRDAIFFHPLSAVLRYTMYPSALSTLLQLIWTVL